MPSFRRGRVARITSERRGLQRVEIVSGGARPDAPPEPAYVLTQLTGPVQSGDEVLFNDTAVRLELGTGGWHVVHANLSRPEWRAPGDGHVMKLRYTSLQVDTGVAEEHLDALPGTLDGTPVVACTLHSQMGVVVATARATHPTLRVAYVMTDGGALPLALSDLVAELSQRGLLAGSVTCGHAFGGDLEAVGLPAALALAKHELGADLIVVAMGPGVVGTELALGTSALEAAPILDTTVALGGQAILCVRASEADGRPRHRGVSHHAATVLQLVRSEVSVPVPVELLDDLAAARTRHRVVKVAVGSADEIAATLDAQGLQITTMGRGPHDDPLFFQAAAAAGLFAAANVRPDTA